MVEIRDQTGRVRGTKANIKGSFKLGRISSRTYKFKVTMTVVQSV